MPARQKSLRGAAYFAFSFQLLALLLASVPAFATAGSPAITGSVEGGLPQVLQPRDDYVNDFAGVMSPPDVQRVREAFNNLERDTGIEAVVITINTIRDYPALPQDSIESFTTALFNQWGVGDARKNNGVVFLVSVSDRNARIELGKGYPELYDQRMQKIMDLDILPHFREGEQSRGIYEGANAIIDNITREPSFLEKWGLPLVVGGAAITLLLIGISLIRSGKKGWGWAAIAAAGVLLVFLITLLSSNKKREGFGGGSSSGGGATGRW